jgi:hypothetical protein
MFLRQITGVVCPTCGERLIILQARAVAVGFVSPFVFGVAGGMALVQIQDVLHEPLTTAQVISLLLVLGALLAVWQFRVVPRFCRVRPATAQETVHYPLSKT